ncbi:MAG: hypothetical protein IKE70_03655, partial [Bacilli bacterium]|nr:hypothetical protein [Bacilli bacterium]
RGYANLVGGLQTIAAQYAKDGYTKSTRMMGYDGQTLTISDTSAFDGSTSIERSTTSTPTPTTGVGEEYSGGVFGDTLYLKDYTLVGNVYKSDTATYGSSGLKAYKVGTTTATAYLLSSRSYFNDNYGNVNFGSRGVSTSGILVSKDLRYFYRDMGSDEFTNYSVRPILTLKSEISIASGSGTKDSPYVLN